ncbi:hypothetical protein KY290_009190 [Solanum tuberosum]|uniref:Ulp1 protease family, C-terminal catalytic domain containing protein n=1 Tax=Solanum tuberosum TaxID=4113 RepID=A0ABQ7WCI2_SOLTU|nr:hypothetical protein KY290_009190 [Solanum tuberosum]
MLSLDGFRGPDDKVKKWLPKEKQVNQSLINQRRKIKNKNEEGKEINDEDGDDEETENDKEDEEEGEKESEEGDEEDGDENESDERNDIESEEGDEDVVKTFNIDKFQVEIPINNPTNLTGDFVVKSAMGAKFDAFRMILMNEKLENFFKSSYFEYFLDLPEANNARFQMSMVYDLLKRMIKYNGDDDNALEDKNKKMDEIWINYCGMPLSSKTNNLYGLPWVFMAWAFEAIPYLRKQFNNYSKEISQPRILRWLSAKNNPKINSVDLFDPPFDIIVHSWLVPTEQELQMPFFLTLGIIDTKSNPTVDLIKKELAGATTIKRETPIVSSDADDVAIDVGDVKKSPDALTSAVKELISKRGGVILSRKISKPFTPLKIKKRRKSISNILANMKKRQQIATTPLPCNVESSSGVIEEQQKL